MQAITRVSKSSQTEHTLQHAAPAAVQLSIVVPCFNEAEGIPNLALQLNSWAKAMATPVDWECVLVDDGSTDKTAETIKNVFADDLKFRLVKHTNNLGLTQALSTGFKHARGRWIACLDADCTYDPSILDLLLEKANQGFDVVAASPYHPDGRVENVAGWRIGLSKIASWMYGKVMRSQLSCYTSCVRIYDAELLRQCPRLTSLGFVGVTELLWHLDRLGARISEVPAVLIPRVTGVSKMRTVRTTLRHLKLMLRILTTPPQQHLPD